MKKWLKKIGIVLAVLAVFLFISIDRVDESPILNSEPYNATLKAIDESIFTHFLLCKTTSPKDFCNAY